MDKPWERMSSDEKLKQLRDEIRLLAGNMDQSFTRIGMQLQELINKPKAK